MYITKVKGKLILVLANNITWQRILVNANISERGNFMIIYEKLWELLKERDMKKTDLLGVISSPTLAKLSKNDNVNVKVIAEICTFLDCQPGDIMENKPKEEVYKDITYSKLDELFVKIEKKTGKSKEEVWQTYLNNVPEKKKQDKDFQDIKKHIES